jgi:hypothetical protein
MKLLLALLVASIAIAQTTAVDATAVSPGTCGGTIGLTTCSWSHTVGTGPYRALYVTIAGLGAAGSVTSVTYGGVALTKIASNTTGWTTDVWRLVNPASGAGTILVTYPALTQTFQFYRMGSLSVYGVDQTTPENTTAVAGTGVCTVNITPTLTNTRLLAVGVNQNGFSSWTGGSNIAATIWDNLAGGAQVSGSGYSNSVASGSQTVGAFACNNGQGVAAVAINPKVINLVTNPSTRIPVPTVLATQYQGTSSGGDTQFTAWVGSGVLAGNFGGGSIIANYNDGSGFGCTTVDACLYRMLTYDPTGVSAATFANVNTFSSYGVFNGDCYDGAGVGTPKTRAPFSLPGLLFQSAVCLTHGTYTPRQAGIIVSPDGGAHWCNWKTYQAHTTSPGCDSSNWVANGDFPVDAAGFQWPATSNNKAGYMQAIDVMCQDFTTSCPTLPAPLDESYLYFHASNNGSSVYIHRVLKSWGMAIMDPSHWDTYSYGSWVSNDTTQGSDVMGVLGGTLSMCCSRIEYISNFGQFVVLGHSGSSTMPFAYAPSMTGPWTQGTSMTVPDNGYQFPSFTSGLCPNYNSGTGQVTCTAFMNGQPSGKDLYIRQVSLGTVEPALVLQGPSTGTTGMSVTVNLSVDSSYGTDTSATAWATAVGITINGSGLPSTITACSINTCSTASATSGTLPGSTFSGMTLQGAPIQTFTFAIASAGTVTVTPTSDTGATAAGTALSITINGSGGGGAVTGGLVRRGGKSIP